MRLLKCWSEAAAAAVVAANDLVEIVDSDHHDPHTRSFLVQGSVERLIASHPDIYDLGEADEINPDPIRVKRLYALTKSLARTCLIEGLVSREQRAEIAQLLVDDMALYRAM